VEINTPDTNNTITSDWGVIKHGALQGSILLFLIHTNDLPLTINTQSKLILFADDTKIEV
jgi:hypothetical protein